MGTFTRMQEQLEDLEKRVAELEKAQPPKAESKPTSTTKKAAQ